MPQENQESIVGQTTGPDLRFRWYDILNIGTGLLEGSMGAIPSSTYNYQCGKNATLARGYLEDMSTEFSKKQVDDGIKEFASALALIDDLTINCMLAVQENSSTNLVDIFTTNEVFINILYNAGFMFTDILDLIFYDSTSTDPFYYYSSFRLGDFLIRFIYSDAP